MEENKYMLQKAMFSEHEEAKRYGVLLILFLILLLFLLIIIMFGVKAGDLVDKTNPYYPGGEVSPSPTGTTSPKPTTSPSPTTTTSPTPTVEPTPTTDPTPTTSPTTSPTTKPTTRPTTSPRPTETTKPDDKLVKFYYSDASGAGNGISIVNAVPTDDSIGKLLVGDKNHFDFYVTATTINRPVSYSIVATKNDGSTLEENSVKVYLTKITGVNEYDITDCYNGGSIKTYSQYSNVDFGLISGRLLYRETIPMGTKSYRSSYRLRIWVNDSAVDWENKDFSLRINVYAVEE